MKYADLLSFSGGAASIGATWLLTTFAAGVPFQDGDGHRPQAKLTPSAPLSTLTPEQEEILSHLSVVHLPDGQGGFRKTIRVKGLNVQLVNGLGATNGFPADPLDVDPVNTVTNGLGNLIVGYREPGSTPDRTGSHSIVLGTGNDHPGFGQALLGSSNAVAAPFAAVTGGLENVASGIHGAVSGGRQNVASAADASASGGFQSLATGPHASVTGGNANEASGDHAVVSGGSFNVASGLRSSVTGGTAGLASGHGSSVTGGNGNTASAKGATVSGGASNIASGRVFDRPGVVERALLRVEVGVAPDGAQAVGARARRPTRERVDARVVGAARHVVDGLARRVPLDPALDYLEALEWRARRALGARVAQRRDQELRSSGIARRLQQVAAHRHAAGVARRSDARVARVVGVVPAPEEAQHQARAAGAVDLAALHGCEERRACVLLGPDDRQTAGVEVELVGEARRKLLAHRRSGAAVPRVVGGFRHQPGRTQVRVGAPDQAELEGVHAEPLFLQQAFLQGVADELAGAGRLRHEAREAPREGVHRELLEAAQLVLALESGVALRVALVLHHLDEPLELRPPAGLGDVDRAAVLASGPEHAAAPRFGLWGITSASQPVPALVHSRRRLAQSCGGLGVSTKLAGSAGTVSPAKMTLRCRLLPVPAAPVHS